MVESIKEYLEVIKSKENYDTEFINELIKSYDLNEDGTIIAARIIEIISKRYDKSKEHKT